MTGIIMETKRKLLVSCIVMFIFSSQTVFCKPLVGRCVSFGEDVEMCRGLSHDMTFLLEDQDVGTFFDTVNQNLKTFYEYTVRTNLSCSDNVKFFLCSMHLPKCDPVTFSLSRPCREVCEEVQSECENSLQEAGLWWPKEFTCSILSSKHDSASSCLQGDEVTYDATELNTTSVSKDVQQEVGNGQFSFETNWVESDDRPQFKSYEQNVINNGSDDGVPTVIEYDDTEIVTDNNHVKVDSADKNGKAVYFNYNTQNDTVHVRAQLEFDNVDQDSLGNQEVENGNGEVEVKLDQTLGQHGVGEVQHGSGQSESGQHGSARSQPGSSQLELGQHGPAQSQPGSGQLESGLQGSGQGQHGSGNTIISDSGQSHYSPRPRSPCEPLLSTSSMMCKQFGYTETKMPNFAGHSTVENATKDMSVFISLIQTGCSSQLAFLLCSVYTPACSSRFPEPIPPCRSVCLNVQKECVSILRTFGIVWPADLSCWNFPLASEQTCLQGSADIFRVQPQVRRRHEEKSITQTFYVTANNTVKTGGSSTIASGSRITDHTHGSTKTDSSRGGTVSTGTRQTYSHATDVCSKDKEKGPCSNYTIRWYFDSKQKACLRFWFGGCDPGENNFMTQEECKKTCSGATGSTEHSSGSDHRTGHGSSSGSHSGSVSARCRQNKDRGPCTKYKVNWYYNYNDKRCQRFWYGGCQGNTNRFETEEECKAACSSDVGTTGETDRGTNTATDDRTGTGSTDNTGDRIVDTSDVCRLPSKLGSCRDYKVKWFHNATTRSCGRFWYGGCDGNGNNFDTKEDCEAKCLITVAVPTTTTTSAPLPTTKPGECPRLSVSNIGPCVQNCKEDLECEGNQKCCSNGCGMTCQDPSDSYLLTPPVNLRADMVSSNTAFVTWTDVDAADATERRFYSVRYKPLSADQDNSYTMLNTTAQQVYVTGLKPSQQYEFAVKVIQGTKFSLWSMAAYNKTRAAASYKPGECPVVTGSAGICVEGCSSDNDCGGSMKCCSNGCGHTCRNPVIVEVAPPEKPTGSGTVAQYCSLDAERGPCSNYSVKWHFSPKDGRCTRFWYGGCQGNKNNFASEDECDAACRKSVTVQDVCQLPQVHGPCKAAHRRWYYDSSSRDCREFLYGGCRGNENRFMTRAECLIRCGSDETKLKVNGFYAMDKSNNKITLKWDPPVMAKDVRQYRLSYSGERYYRDGIQRDDTSVLDIPGSASSYSINGLKPATQYKFNLTAILGDGRRGPTEYLITNTMSETPEYKQGECPRVEMTEYVNPDCKQLCSTDYDCADNLKCCRDSCGKSCQRPRPRETIRMCYDAQYGCCLDDVTIAQGPNYEGCPDACQTSEFGCCRDGTTPASGPNGDGCEYGSGTDDNFCEQSVYQCCADGITPAQGPNKEGCPEYTTTTQKPVDLGPVCQQPAQRGPCSDYTVKYFYNATSSKCQRFWYGGCQGNQNNFDNSEDCEATCTQKETLPVCQQPKRTGRCRGYFKKFYYNSQSGKCEQFIYGGCDGNDNNFEAEDDCRRKCETGDRITNNRCQLPADVGPCGGSIPRWFFDTRRGECVEFGWGGCEGNLNNFIDKETCLQQCSEKVVIGRNGDVCRMPSETGRCRAAVPRWFYDYNDGICKKFTYGGCEGNQNNFQTKEECQSRCSREYVCRPYEEPTVACLAYFPRYRYIAAKDDCEQFIYGGCLGSSNNFETLAACRGKCQGPVDPPVYDNICALIPEAGRCRGREIKWFFNSTASRCERFIYGGCDGNPNRFDTLEECDGFCNVDGSGVVTVDVDIGVDSSYCHLPKDVGHCNNNTFPAWYYDHQEGVCKEFVFGGCGGNKNRFTSREVCESSCSRDVVCRLQQETGPCKAKIPRYYYDLRTGRCTKFGYGGCDGNANNFATREACGNKCGDAYTPDGTTSISPSIPKEQCQQPKDFGNGQGREVMYYYNPAVGDCQPFWYSGAGGNNNRFRNSTRCRTVCRRDNTRVPVVTPRPPVTTTPPTIPSPDPGTDVIITGNECDENSERGPCTNYTVKWFYNRSQGRCTRFWYGGCEGNGNKFDSEAACKARCVEKVYTGSETADLVDGNATVIIEQPDRSLLIECRGPQGTVAWYKNARILTSDQRFTVFENGSLFIAQLNKDDSGVYACRIDNGQNQPAVRRFRLQIEVPITIFPTPSTIVVRPGENAFLHCQAYGSPQPTVTWTKDGQSIASGGRYYMYQNGTLIISNTQQTDISDYTCTARNGRSSPAQRLVRLSLQESVSASIKPIDGRLREGENLYLACDSRGFPPPTVRWEKMGVELITTGRMTVNGPNLRITDLTLDDTGSYTCVVNNAEDSAKDSKSIQVIPKDVDIPECVDSASVTMCRLIVRAGLCGYTDYSKQCCYSCDQSKLRG